MNKKLISKKMKIFLLIMIILSICFYVSGYIILIKSNYKLSDYSEELKFNSNSIPFNFGNYIFDLINPYSSYDYDVSENLSEINFNITSQNIKVMNYNGNTLNIKIKGFSSSDMELDSVKTDNKITFSSNIDIPDYMDIIVRIPESISDKIMLKITTRNGDIDINNLSCNYINLSSATGNINLQNCKLNYIYSSNSCGDINLNSINSAIETNLSNAYGSINCEGNLGILTGNTTSGDINLVFKDYLRNVFITSVSGNIELYMPLSSGYEVSYSTLSGTLNASEEDLFNTDKSNKINVRTNSGNLNVYKN